MILVAHPAIARRPDGPAPSAAAVGRPSGQSRGSTSSGGSTGSGGSGGSGSSGNPGEARVEPGRSNAPNASRAPSDPPTPPSPPTNDPACAAGQGECRLNVLLSYAGWHQESWADQLPVLLQPFGVRSLRATSARQATEVIRQSRVHIAVVDLGLPLECSPAAGQGVRDEEAGPRLLELLARLPDPPPTVVVKRGRTSRDDSRDMTAALRAGAFAVVDRPREPRDLELMLEVFRRCLTRFYRGRWPGTS